MYHLVSPTPRASFRKYTVTPKAFTAQMKWLRLARYHPISFDDWLEYSWNRTTLPRASVIITFDDGFQDCFTYAVPILRAYGFPATFFIVAGLVGKTSRWMAKESKPDLPLMNWNTLGTLSGLGFECGSHTVTHPRLSELSGELCRQELSCSKSLLEDRLGRQIRHLAYPFGSYDDRVRGLAQNAGYASACTTRIGLCTASENPMVLPRVPVLGDESLLDFAWRLFCGSRPNSLIGQVIGRLRSSLKIVRTGRQL
jgi:peptidoglycan/xylan/chitin deacetylase (PgdA/CDA1 family)